MNARCLTLLVVVCWFASGCFRTPPSQLYLLAPSKVESLGENGLQSTSLRIREVVLPEYLRRPEMVILRKSGELYVREFDRWAEPLDESLSRSLGERIAYAGKKSLDLVVTIKAFEPREESMSVVLLAVWRDGGRDYESPSNSFQGSVTLPPGEFTVEDTVSAMDSLIEQLAAAISTSLN